MQLSKRQEWMGNYKKDLLAGVLVALALIPEAISFVGLFESFLTANVVDDLTDTPSNKNKEAFGQGIANIVSGLFGGMADCAMIGQSVINIKSGGRTRLSSLSAGIFLLLFMLFLGSQVEKIPMAVLVAIMIMVSIGTLIGLP